MENTTVKFAGQDNTTIVVKEVVSHEDLTSIKKDLTGVWGNGKYTVITVKGEFSGNLSDQKEITLVFSDGKMHISNCEIETDGDKITIRKKTEWIMEVEFIEETQVLPNKNNEVKTMENQKVMAKVASLYKESTSSRVRNVQLSVESSVIRQAFGIKNGEIDKAIKMLKEVENFNRKTVLTDKQITEKYMEYIEFFKWAKATDSNSRYDAEIKLEYFVKGVDFFNKPLAEKLKQIAINQ